MPRACCGDRHIQKSARGVASNTAAWPPDDNDAKAQQLPRSGAGTVGDGAGCAAPDRRRRCRAAWHVCNVCSSDGWLGPPVALALCVSTVNVSGRLGVLRDGARVSRVAAH